MNKQLSPSIAFFIICVFLVLEYLFYNWLYIKFYFSTIFNFVFYFIKHRSIIILMSVSDNSNIQSIHKFLSPLFQLIVDYVVLSFVCSVKLCLCFHCIWKIFCWNYFRQRWYYIPFGLLLSNIRLSSNTRPLVWGLLQKVCEEYCFFFFSKFFLSCRIQLSVSQIKMWRITKALSWQVIYSIYLSGSLKLTKVLLSLLVF